LVGEGLSVMRKLADEGMTMIIVTHQMGFARQAADLVIFMEGGVIVEQNRPEILVSPRGRTHGQGPLWQRSPKRSDGGEQSDQERSGKVEGSDFVW
jgi:ABC-type glutathione transport system ATPase component